MNLLKRIGNIAARKDTGASSRSYSFRLRAITLVALALAIGFGSSRLAQEHATAGKSPQPRGGPASGNAFLFPALVNAERQKDPALVESDKLATFSILNPELVNREHRKDPQVVESERLSGFTILNARLLEAERAKDPQMRKEEQDAWRRLVGN